MQAGYKSQVKTHLKRTAELVMIQIIYLKILNALRFVGEKNWSNGFIALDKVRMLLLEYFDESMRMLPSNYSDKKMWKKKSYSSYLMHNF